MLKRDFVLFFDLFNKWRYGEGVSAPILTPAHQTMTWDKNDKIPILRKHTKNWVRTNKGMK